MGRAVRPWRVRGAIPGGGGTEVRLSPGARIRGAVYEHLVPGGCFLATLKSVRADSFGIGDETEPGTFVQDSGPEAGVPHHYFEEAEIRRNFDAWELCVLLERVCDYRERCGGFLELNPFDYTAWCVLARKPAKDHDESDPRAAR